MFTYKTCCKKNCKTHLHNTSNKSKTNFHFFAPCILSPYHSRYRMHRGAREPFKPPHVAVPSPQGQQTNKPMCPRKPPGKPVWGILVVDILIPYELANLHKPPSRTCCSTSAAVSAMAELFGILDLSYRAQESDNNARGIRWAACWVM